METQSYERETHKVLMYYIVSEFPTINMEIALVQVFFERLSWEIFALFTVFIEDSNVSFYSNGTSWH